MVGRAKGQLSHLVEWVISEPGELVATGCYLERESDVRPVLRGQECSYLFRVDLRDSPGSGWNRGVGDEGLDLIFVGCNLEPNAKGEWIVGDVPIEPFGYLPEIAAVVIDDLELHTTGARGNIVGVAYDLVRKVKEYCRHSSFTNLF